MEKFIPYEKLSKKQKRAADAAKRRSWNGINPVTRVNAAPKAYNRAKIRSRYNDTDADLSFLPSFSASDDSTALAEHPSRRLPSAVRLLHKIFTKTFPNPLTKADIYGILPSVDRRKQAAKAPTPQGTCRGRCKTRRKTRIRDRKILPHCPYSWSNKGHFFMGGEIYHA